MCTLTEMRFNIYIFIYFFNPQSGISLSHAAELEVA